MSDAAWPSWMPSPVQYTETPGSMVLQSPVESGLPKSRRFSTRALRSTKVGFELNWQELEDFETWLNDPVNGLQGGAKAFRGPLHRDWRKREARKMIVPTSIEINWIGAENFMISFTELVWDD